MAWLFVISRILTTSGGAMSSYINIDNKLNDVISNCINTNDLFARNKYMDDNTYMLMNKLTCDLAKCWLQQQPDLQAFAVCQSQLMSHYMLAVLSLMQQRRCNTENE